MLDLITLAVKDYGVAGNLKDHGINVTLSGVLIVFAMLVLLVWVIWVFGAIMTRITGQKKPPKVKKEKTEQPKVKVAAAKSSAPVAPAATAAEDQDVLAAISAAVMMMYEGTGKTPVIRSVRPAAKGARSVWASAGIANNTRPF